MEQCLGATNMAGTEKQEGANQVLAEESTDILPAGTTLGSYEILEVLGEGGMGCVYLAEHTKLGRKVALKTLYWDHAAQRDLVKRFFAEARAANQISHENIVEITDFVEDEASGTYYLVMELLEGMDLKELMKREGVLDLDRAIKIAIQVSDALLAAHEAGIIHRDIKPANLFLIERAGWDGDFIKILDFGVAKLAEGARQAVAREITLEDTAPGIILGTPTYMSPEQASARPIDHRSDIYSFGIILYLMVTGQTPFKGDNVADLLIQHMTVQPPKPSRVEDLPHKIPLDLERLIMSCLAKAPENRPESMKEVRQRLEAIDLDAKKRPSSRSRGPAPWIGLGVVAVAVIFGALWFTSSPQDNGSSQDPPVEISGAETNTEETQGADAGDADRQLLRDRDVGDDAGFDAARGLENDGDLVDARPDDIADLTPVPTVQTQPVKRPPLQKARPPRRKSPSPSPSDLEAVLDPYED